MPGILVAILLVLFVFIFGIQASNKAFKKGNDSTGNVLAVMWFISLLIIIFCLYQCSTNF